jgi:hypothetical protein
VRNVAVTTDDELLARVTQLLDAGLRRELWLMFLDERRYQLPVIMPIDVPRRPRQNDRAGFAGFIRDLADDLEAPTVIVTLERRGNDSITPDDAEWFRLVHSACAEVGLELRGPMLCHGTGVRWVAMEDYAVS